MPKAVDFQKIIIRLRKSIEKSKGKLPGKLETDFDRPEAAGKVDPPAGWKRLDTSILGYMTVTRIDKDSIWLEGDDGKEIGPIPLPKKAAQLLQPDWKINCALAKSRGKWHFAEVGNVYPD